MTSVKVKSGLILFDKPAEVTSFKVLAVVKQALKLKKVGHAGTLDKFATGLLLILTGAYTRLVPYFTNLDKEYEATFQFGLETATLDPEGEPVCTGRIPAWEEIEAVLGKFQGMIDQVPPDYSAVHLNGKRAYELANRGLSPELKPRPVHIYSLDVINYLPPVLTLRIRCSKGTYIRALARDIGRASGSCAYVTSLRRTAIGSFQVNTAVAPAEFKPEADLKTAQEFLPLLNNFSTLTVHPEMERRILQGQPIGSRSLEREPLPGEKLAVFSQAGQLLALAEYPLSQTKTQSYRYLAVFNRLDD